MMGVWRQLSTGRVAEAAGKPDVLCGVAVQLAKRGALSQPHLDRHKAHRAGRLAGGKLQESPSWTLKLGGAVLR